MKEKVIKLSYINGSLTKTIEVYEDGTVCYSNINNNLKHLSNLNIIYEYFENLDLNTIRKSAFDEKCKVEYKGNVYCSSQIYSDIELMIRNDESIETINNVTNEVRNASKIKEEKEKDRLEKISLAIPLLDKYENTRFDFTKNSNEIDEKRSIISFDLIEKDNFELGESRIFAETIDISPDVDYPSELEFVAQIKLSDFAQYDKYDLLPKTGYLYFFESPLIEDKSYNFGKVIYSDKENLERKEVLIFNDYQIFNNGIGNIKSEIESFEDRLNEDAHVRCEIEETNKIFGYYTDCQMDEEELKQVSNNYVVLLQIGSELYGEGITTFLIHEEDLKNKKFEKAIFNYSQS